MVKNFNKTADNLWNMLFTKLEQKVDEPGMNPHKVSKLLDVSSTAVYRWLNGERGDRIPMRECLRLIEKLGVPMSEVVDKLYPNQAEVVLKLLDLDNGFLLKLAEILDHDESSARKIVSDVEYIHSMIQDK